MNYGIDLADQYPQNGVCVARDLKGQPAYLPVIQPKLPRSDVRYL